MLTGADGVRAIAGPVPATGTSERRTALEAPRWDNQRRTAVLQYSIGAPGATARLAVIDVRGRLLWSTAPRVLTPGTYLETWDGRTSGGALIPRGIYFVRLDSGARGWARKLVRAGP